MADIWAFLLPAEGVRLKLWLNTGVGLTASPREGPGAGAPWLLAPGLQASRTSTAQAQAPPAARLTAGWDRAGPRARQAAGWAGRSSFIGLAVALGGPSARGQDLQGAGRCHASSRRPEMQRA